MTVGSLADLVSGVQELTPPFDPVPVGTVMVALRHNNPVMVVRTGTKLRRGKGLPLTWKPSAIYVSTQDIPVDVGIPDIKLDDEFPLAHLALQVVIRVNPANDFEGLVNYIHHKGINFADLLDGEVSTEVGAMVRRCLRNRTSVELYGTSSLEDLLLGQGELLGGLFQIVRLYGVVPTYHPEFVHIRELNARTTREIAEKVSRLEQLDYDRAVAAADDQVLAEIAWRRGLSIDEYENPELRALREQNSHDIEVKKIEAFPELRGRDQLDRFERLHHGGPPPRIGATPPGLAPGRGAPYEQTFSYDEGPQPGRGDQRDHGRPPADRRPIWDDDGPDDLSVDDTVVDYGLDQLRCDPTLLDVWQSAQLPGTPVGLSHRSDDRGRTVLAVSSDKVDAKAVVAVFKERFGATSVICISGVSELPEVVGRYLAKHVPDLRTADARLLLRRQDRSLVLGLASKVTRMRPFVLAINEPGSGILSTLQTLLPYDTIEIEVVDAG